APERESRRLLDRLQAVVAERRDPVALLDAQRREGVGQPARTLEELRVGLGVLAAAHSGALAVLLRARADERGQLHRVSSCRYDEVMFGPRSQRRRWPPMRRRAKG